MDFLSRLNKLMEDENITKTVLSSETGIPYTTIDSFYKKGYENIKLSNLRKISDYFNVSLDYLIKGDSIYYSQERRCKHGTKTK